MGEQYNCAQTRPVAGPGKPRPNFGAPRLSSIQVRAPLLSLRPSPELQLRHHLPFGQRNHGCVPGRVAVARRNRRAGRGLAGRGRYGHGHRPGDVSSGFAHQLHAPVYAKLGEQR